MAAEAVFGEIEVGTSQGQGVDGDAFRQFLAGDVPFVAQEAQIEVDVVANDDSAL